MVVKKHKVLTNLDYLYNKPKIIYWEVVAGPSLHPLQMYDVIYDSHDLKIRKLDKSMLI
jgi:hypothetical protein